MVARGAKLEKRLKISNKTLDMEYGCIVTMHQYKRVRGQEPQNLENSRFSGFKSRPDPNQGGPQGPLS